MSTDRDVTRIVRSWLEDGANALPDRVLDAVLDQLPATPQRRAGWLARRLPPMNKMVVRIGLVAAAIVLIGVLGVRFLPQMNIGGGPTPTPTPTLASLPLLNGQGFLDGRYRVNSGLMEEVSVAVPTGWSAGTDWVVIGPKGNQLPNGMAIRFYTVTDMLKNPSVYADGFLSPRPGPTANDLVQAIANQPAWNASAPSDTTVAGYPGKHIQVTIPQGATFDPRDNGAFYLFDGIWGWAPGQTFELYVVDVVGERLVVDAFHYPGTSQADLAAQQAVIATIQIAPRFPSSP